MSRTRRLQSIRRGRSEGAPCRPSLAARRLGTGFAAAVTAAAIASTTAVRSADAQEGARRPSRCLTDTTATAPTGAALAAATTDTVAPGMTYSCRRVAQGPWLLHVVSIDLRSGRLAIDAERASGRRLGRERVSDMAARLRAAGKAPLVIINADFFDLQTGEVENNHVERGEWVKGLLLSDSPHDEFDNAHTQLAIDARGQPSIGRHRLDGRVIARDRAEPLVGINYRPPRPAGLVLYTPRFGPRTPSDSSARGRGNRPVDPDARPPGATPDTSPPRAPSTSQLRADSARLASLAATREALELSLRRVGNSADTLLYEVTAEVARVGGGTVISPEGAVLSATGNARAFVRALAGRGGRLRVVARLAPSGLAPRAVVGGWPGVVRDGVNVAARADSLEGTFPRFSSARHPRSAVAVTRDSSTLLLVVVDGRRPWSVGMSLSELADQLLALGAWQAMNFDGGGSSALWVNGSVVNYPSDPSGERAVGNALVVYKAAATPPLPPAPRRRGDP